MGDLQIYYNTANLAGEDLNKATKKAGSQTEQILDFFKHHRDKSFTAREVHVAVKNGLLTSTRRAINTLINTGDVASTGHVQGKYQQVHTFQYDK